MYLGFLEEGDKCKEFNCPGKMVYPEVENCSCHISPPCSACTSIQLICDECGWQDDAPEYKDVPVAPYLYMREMKPRPLDRSKIDYRTKMHSSCSQLVEGVYPEGTKASEVEAIVKGTFGGRFEKFSNGDFVYIAYTD